MNLSNFLDWPKVVDKLPKLQSLTLSYCDLPIPILSSLSHINTSKSLSSVDLSGNHLTWSIFHWLSTCNTNLKSVDLSANKLSGSIPDIFGNLSSLLHLRLAYNSIEGQLPETFGQLCSLQSLDLSRNNLSGSIPDVFGNLSSLLDLSLTDNSVEGQLPKTIGQLCSLQSLFLSGNNHSGEFSEFIQVLFGCAGVITEAHFSNLSKLQVLDLSSNSLTLNIRSDWLPPFQLSNIRLRSCKIGPYFPKWLRTSQNSFGELDLSDAGISDIIPSWFQDYSGSEVLNLSSNQLEGPIHSLPSGLVYVDLSSNKLSGRISFLCAGNRNLQLLDLSSNSFSGELPNCWKHLENLVILDLSHNAFSGKIPSSIGSLASLETMKLSKNNFEGELPSSLKNYTNLKVFDIGENRITGMIPEWIGISFLKLAILIFRSNQFSGSLPLELCHLKNIQLLDLSRNTFSGTIPQCLNNLTTLAQKGSSIPSIKHYRDFYILATTSLQNYEDDASFIWKGRMSDYKSTLGLVKIIDFC
ncbi:receptor-like protein EIX2 [Rosa chinensis]|uniref:receptor-like protein EIX2 n=1 Tax=Rosa chinensis TaxID=74649 RepID=UPI000D092BF5|nr:receptor-like protein EIX2 [Rosa chinensis]